MGSDLGSGGAKVYGLLLLMILHLFLTICLSLVLTGLGVSVWSLPPVALGCSRSPGKPTDYGVLKRPDALIFHSGGADWKGIDNVLYLVLSSVSKHFIENIHIFIHQ